MLHTVTYVTPCYICYTMLHMLRHVTCYTMLHMLHHVTYVTPCYICYTMLHHVTPCYICYTMLHMLHNVILTWLPSCPECDLNNIQPVTTRGKAEDLHIALLFVHLCSSCSVTHWYTMVVTLSLTKIFNFTVNGEFYFTGPLIKWPSTRSVLLVLTTGSKSSLIPRLSGTRFHCQQYRNLSAWKSGNEVTLMCYIY